MKIICYSFNKIVRPLMSETTALGVAMTAGSAEGIKKWDLKIDTTVPCDTFLPSISDNGKLILFFFFFYT